MTLTRSILRIALLLVLPVILGMSIWGLSRCTSAFHPESTYTKKCGLPFRSYTREIVEPWHGTPGTIDTKASYSGLVGNLIIWLVPITAWTLAFRRLGKS